jgi:1-acyl-sn-glycerol-3-phosphate acyltransferase
MLDRLLYWSGKSAVTTYAHTRLRLDVAWEAPLPQGAKIIAPNHPTTTDPFVITSLVSERVHILVDDTLFKVPVLGRFLHATGHVPVIAGQGLSALVTAQKLLQAGETLVIFPEGAISPPTGGYAPAHTGTARLALLTGAPIIPVGIDMPRERVRHITVRVDGRPEVARWYFGGPYAITIGQPLYFAGTVNDRAHVQAITQHIMYCIDNLAAASQQRRQAATVTQRREPLRMLWAWGRHGLWRRPEYQVL